MLLSFHENLSAVANAAVLTPKAPCTPNLSMLKNTETTMALRGIPNKFITTERWLSGKYFERSVPMAGKYMPTHDSNTKRLAISTPSTEAREERAFAVPPWTYSKLKGTIKQIVERIEFSRLTKASLDANASMRDKQGGHRWPGRGWVLVFMFYGLFMGKCSELWGWCFFLCQQITILYKQRK
jgi:hypothetical protein